MNRREFLKTSAGTTGLFLGTGKLFLKTLEPIPEIANPLEFYPDKDWEKVYRDQYRYDSSFTYICSPNDTHACRVRAYVRNGVAVRLEQSYDHQSYGDGLGNTATPQWNPRMCLKGFAFQRRVYGPFRLRYPLVRKGWKEWADDGFPELTPENKARYKFDRRGQDELLRVTWDQAFAYAAKGMIAIAKKYSGSDGRKRLQDEGYPEEMLTHWNEAGTRTFKLRGGMGLL
ncbi:MAG: molybdopterin-dependent oxidoreductase, partial [Armatimonadetes bacterium]|nr:molybdopterin-dependent oxidoreductase [Armatimonadota bacterium]